MGERELVDGIAPQPQVKRRQTSLMGCTSGARVASHGMRPFRFGMTWFLPRAKVALAVGLVVALITSLAMTDTAAATSETAAASEGTSERTGISEGTGTSERTGISEGTGISERTVIFSAELDFSSGRGATPGVKPVDSQIEWLHRRGITGAGIDVAIIDTGVSPVPGLDGPDKLLHGPDLSVEGSQANLANQDTYGHGTHLAGIIAGDDGEGFVGVAPDARLVSVKIAGADGETSVAQAVAAIEWVIEHRNTDGLNIRVLNLSFGLEPDGDPLNDPLVAAVERAWDAGIVVVAAAGNRGSGADGIDSPARSPLVIAVAGGESTAGVAGVSSWSSAGNGERNPDVVGAGRSVVSFRVPGSAISLGFPEARVEDRFGKGTGTSQATASVSGAAALLLSARPSLSPDDVKFLLRMTATDVDVSSTQLDGNGMVRPARAASSAWMVRWRRTAQNVPRAMAEVDWSSHVGWSGGTWSGATWSGATWSGATWSGATWSGATWSGATWSGATWSGATWSSEEVPVDDVLGGGGATVIDWEQARWAGTGWDHSGVAEQIVRVDDMVVSDDAAFDYKSRPVPTATPTPTPPERPQSESPRPTRNPWIDMDSD